MWRTSEDRALVLIDYQPEMFEAIRSETAADLVELHVRWLAKTAKAFRHADRAVDRGSGIRHPRTRSLGASGLELTTAELERIEAAVPAGAAAGARYAEPLMAELDSERRAV